MSGEFDLSIWWCGLSSEVIDQVKFKMVDEVEHDLRDVYDVIARTISLGKTTDSWFKFMLGEKVGHCCRSSLEEEVTGIAESFEDGGSGGSLSDGSWWSCEKENNSILEDTGDSAWLLYYFWIAYIR